MNAQAATVERFLWMMRRYLRIANEYERGRQIALADAAGAIASYYLQRAIGAQERAR